VATPLAEAVLIDGPAKLAGPISKGDTLFFSKRFGEDGCPVGSLRSCRNAELAAIVDTSSPLGGTPCQHRAGKRCVTLVRMTRRQWALSNFRNQDRLGNIVFLCRPAAQLIRRLAFPGSAVAAPIIAIIRG